VWHGDRETRDSVRLEEHRLGPTAAGLRERGLSPEAAVYNDDFADEVKEQLLAVQAVLVWVNPIEQGRDRSKLDAMLRDVADAGVLVSAHPSTILKMGTKEVLYKTRGMSWGSDVNVYRDPSQIRQELPKQLLKGPRVLKQLRGHSGQGVWKVTPMDDPQRVLLRHAPRGSVEQAVSLEELFKQFEPYFQGGASVIDQAYQAQIAAGMVRSYLVRDRVQGFGHQAVNALVPAPSGLPAEEAPQPGPRLYYPPDQPEFQEIRTKMEQEWLPDLLRTLDMELNDLPLLWDADLMFGGTKGSYVLCEINVSSVYPYPESAIKPLAQAVADLLRT
jgi:hypothetical protein